MRPSAASFVTTVDRWEITDGQRLPQPDDDRASVSTPDGPRPPTRLRAFIARRVETPELADDITQDVLARSLASGLLDTVDNPTGWLYRAARNAVIDHYRLRRRHQPLIEDNERWTEPESDDGGPNDATREAGPLPPASRRTTPRHVPRRAHPRRSPRRDPPAGRRRHRHLRVRHEVDASSEAATDFETSSQPAAPCAPTAPARSSPIEPTSVAVHPTAKDPSTSNKSARRSADAGLVPNGECSAIRRRLSRPLRAPPTARAAERSSA